jgi:transcriptional accessory protein Tex/SPT6
MARGIDVVRKYDLSEDELDTRVAEAFAELNQDEMSQQYEESVREFEEDTILKGRVLNVVNDEVIVDIGYKSEGLIPLVEFGDTEVDIGDEIEVLLDEIEDETGMIRLSKRKADRIRAWNRPTRKATSSRASCSARSRVACSSTSACRSSCRRARSRCGAPRTSPSSSARRSRRASSRSTSSA